MVAEDGTTKRLGPWDVLNKSDANIKTISDILIQDLKHQNASYILSVNLVVSDNGIS